MSVERRGRAVFLHEPLDRPDIFGEMLDGNGNIFDDRHRLGITADAHQETQAGLSDRPNIGLALGIQHAERGRAEPDSMPRQAGFKPVTFRR